MSAIPDVQRALKAAFLNLYPDAESTLGAPALTTSLDMAVVGDGTADLSKPTVGGSQRSREEEAKITCILSCYRTGDTEAAQIEANGQAWAMLKLLEEYLRTRGNETLGGVCREAWVSGYEAKDYRLSDDNGYVPGRACDLTVTVTAVTRL